MKRIILPIENAKEASIVEGIEVIGVKSLKQVVNFLNGKEKIMPQSANLEQFFNRKNKGELSWNNGNGRDLINGNDRNCHFCMHTLCKEGWKRTEVKIGGEERNMYVSEEREGGKWISR